MIDNGPMVASYVANAALLGRTVRDPLRSVIRWSARPTWATSATWSRRSHPMIQVADDGVPIHTAAFRRNSPAARHGDQAVLDGAKAMAMTVIDLWADARLRDEVAARFAGRPADGNDALTRVRSHRTEAIARQPTGSRDRSVRCMRTFSCEGGDRSRPRTTGDRPWRSSRLTGSTATAMQSAQGAQGNRPPRRSGGPDMNTMMAPVADELGMSVEELQSTLAGGTTLDEIASTKGSRTTTCWRDQAGPRGGQASGHARGHERRVRPRRDGRVDRRRHPAASAAR
ncbi:MAG: hypothetical protein R2713_17690 [Ilumatobacteraceae bacterium]